MTPAPSLEAILSALHRLGTMCANFSQLLRSQCEHPLVHLQLKACMEKCHKFLETVISSTNWHSIVVQGADIDRHMKVLTRGWSLYINDTCQKLLLDRTPNKIQWCLLQVVDL